MATMSIGILTAGNFEHREVATEVFVVESDCTEHGLYIDSLQT